MIAIGTKVYWINRYQVNMTGPYHYDMLDGRVVSFDPHTICVWYGIRIRFLDARWAYPECDRREALCRLAEFRGGVVDAKDWVSPYSEPV